MRLALALLSVTSREDTSMMMTFAADLTSTLAPFGWAAAGFVVLGLGAVLTALIVARGARPAVSPRVETSESGLDEFRPAA